MKDNGQSTDLYVVYTTATEKHGDYVKGTEEVTECSSGDVASRMLTPRITPNDYHNPTNSASTAVHPPHMIHKKQMSLNHLCTIRHELPSLDTKEFAWPHPIWCPMELGWAKGDRMALVLFTDHMV